MKKILSGLLALCILLTVLPAVCLAASPECSYTVSGVTREGTIAAAVTAVKSSGGTIKLLQDISYTGASYNIKTNVPFTLDLNGHTLRSSAYGIGVGSNATGVVGTALNGTTVIKNGTLISEKQNVLIFQGGLQMENVTAWSNVSQNIAFYDVTGNYNANNLISGCTFANPAWGAFTFNSRISQSKTKMTFVNSTLANVITGGGSTIERQKEVEDAQVVLGKGMRFLTYHFAETKLFNRGLRVTGEAVTRSNALYRFDICGYSFDGLRLWTTEGATLLPESSNNPAFQEVAAPPEVPDGVTLPVQDVADIPSNRWKGLREVAFAYHRKNAYHQYDYTAMSVLGRYHGIRPGLDYTNTPEMASPDRTIHNVCTSYVYHCLFHGLGIRLMGGIGGTDIDLLPAGLNLNGEFMDHIVIFQYTNDPNNTAANAAKTEQVRQMLQPGDVVSYRRIGDNSGHTVIWLGEDVTGDGTMDLINVDGKYFDTTNNIDVIETRGAVNINAQNSPASSPMYNSGEYFLFSPESTQYLAGKTGYEKAVDYYSVIRVTDKQDLFPMPESAKTRVLFPEMDIYYTAQDGLYGAVDKTGEMTYTLQIKNNSPSAYQGILVQIPAPENGKITKINGATTAEAMVKRTLNVPAGTTATLTYTVKPTGNVGEYLHAKGGFVHAIPLPEIKTSIRSGALSASAVSTAVSSASGTTGTAFVNKVLTSLGVDYTVPELSFLPDKLFGKETIGYKTVYIPQSREETAGEHLELQDMLIPDFFGGRYFNDGVFGTRVRKLRTEDLQAGDILIWQEKAGGSFYAAVHDGSKILWNRNGTPAALSQTVDASTLQSPEQMELDHFFYYHLFFALRPTQLGKHSTHRVSLWNEAGTQQLTSLPTGSFTARVNVTNRSDAASGLLLIATYDGDGKMLSLTPKTVSMAAKSVTPVSVPVTNGGSTVSVKAFLIPSLAQFAPLCPADTASKK